MIMEFLTWWGQQLSSLRPQRSIATRPDGLCATLRAADAPGNAAAGIIDAVLVRRGKAGDLGSFPLTDAGMAALTAATRPRRPPVHVRLPPGAMLQQSVMLPLAAERDPARVLRYEMDRLTPFTIDELYWDWAIERRDRARGQLHLRLSLAPRSRVDPVLEMLRQAGLPPVALEGADGRRIALGRERQDRWLQRGVATLAAACVLLAIAATVIPFIQQSVRAWDVERRIVALRPMVDQMDALRRRMTNAAAGLDALASQRERSGDTLAIVATLTDVLPDNTVLTDLALSKRIIIVSGQSTAAAQLISALAADPAIRNPAFTAPVTLNETTHTEGFTIRAEAAP
jgi:general secretion pathway protein L